MSEEPEGESLTSIAARGLTAPETLTPDETQSLCGFVLQQSGETPPPAPTYGEAARAELEARRAEYQRKADKRRNEAGYATSVAELDAWVAEIDAELGA